MKTLPDNCLFLLLLLGPAGLSVALHLCGPKHRQHPTQASPPAVAPAYSYRLLPAADSTYGYEIRRHSRPLIRQLTVPGRAGSRGFVQPALARATAGLAIAKLVRGHRLPTITAHELDSLESHL